MWTPTVVVAIFLNINPGNLNDKDAFNLLLTLSLDVKLFYALLC